MPYRLISGRWGNNPNDIDDIRIDRSTNSLQCLTYEHHEIHAQSHYFVKGYQDASITNVMDFTWLMPAAPKEIHWTWALAVEGETLFEVYEGAVATSPPSTAVTAFNNDRNSTNTSDTTMLMELFANLAAANAVTDVSGATLIETGVIGDGNIGGNASRNNEIIMKAGTLYCLRTTATKAGTQSFAMEWYEHTSKNP